jgi:hypothetical protein
MWWGWWIFLGYFWLGEPWFEGMMHPIIDLQSYSPVLAAICHYFKDPPAVRIYSDSAAEESIRSVFPPHEA